MLRGEGLFYHCLSSVVLWQGLLDRLDYKRLPAAGHILNHTTISCHSWMINFLTPRHCNRYLGLETVLHKASDSLRQGFL